MFQKKTEKQQKQKKLRVYTVNSRKPAVIALWLRLWICVCIVQELYSD